MLKRLGLTLALIPSLAYAGDNAIDFVNFDNQSQFKSFAEDLTGQLAFKTIEPAEPLGTIGFDFGISYNRSSVDKNNFARVSNNAKDQSHAITLHANKGLPFGIDLGVAYHVEPLGNISTLGGKLSYAILEGGVASPALTVTGSYTQTTDLKTLDYQSYGLDLGVSKGFVNVTPFASVGLVNGEINAQGTNLGSAGNLESESVSMMKLAAGFNVNLLLMDLTFAVNQIGEVPTYSLKAGYRF